MNFIQDNNMIDVTCDNCSITFPKKAYECKRTTNNFCCKECFDSFQSITTNVSCTNCSSTFIKTPSQIKKSKSGNHFCSKSCAATYNNTHKTHGTRRSKLEVYLEEQIRKHYPDLKLLCNDKTAINSELDFYFPEQKLAIELNGIFHYEPIYGEEKLSKIQENDERKFLLCQRAKISLAIIDSSSCKYLSKSAKDKYWAITDSIIKKQFGRCGI